MAMGADKTRFFFWHGVYLACEWMSGNIDFFDWTVMHVWEKTPSKVVEKNSGVPGYALQRRNQKKYKIPPLPIYLASGVEKR